jgi:DNA invertase Pin-like site-specific DNA recombinase
LTGVDVDIYARLSRDRSGLSENTTIQREECKQYVCEQGWNLIGIHEDNDISASKYSTKARPGYEKLVEDIRNNRVDVVLVTEMPRLYRRMEELLDLIRLAESTSLQRIETTDGVGYHLGTGEGIHAAVAAINNAMLESRKISDRVKRKQRARAQQGLHNGGSRRYGYEWDGMTICEPEAAVIRECIERSINGEMAWRIARDLNERGVPTTYGKKWVTANLQRMLLSPRIIGVRRHLGVDYPAQWPAITTPEVQERIRIVWRSRQQTPGRPRGARTYLLTGFAYCGRCDQPMRGNGRTLASGAYQRRYRCSPIDIHGESLGCGHMFRAAEPLEQFVSEAVLYRFDSPEIALALAGPGQEGEIAKIVTEIEFCRQKLNDYVDDYASGLLDRTQLARAKARTESELDEHQDRLSSLQRLQNASRLPNEPLRDAWNEMELESKREVIQLVVERVIVHPGLPGVKTWESFRLNPEQIEIVWRV